MDKQKIIIFILAFLLLIAIGYIAFLKYREYQYNIFQRGVEVGYQQAIIQMIGEVSKCQQVPLYAGNRTVNVVAVDCLMPLPTGNSTS